MTSTKSVAFFKTRPLHSLPFRPGPVQCIRNCPNCVHRQEYQLGTEQENIIAMKSYEDLVLRKHIYVTIYRSIIYHVGQIDVVKNALRWINASKTIYIVACTQIEDLEYLKMVFELENLPNHMKIIDKLSIKNVHAQGTDNKVMIMPVSLRSCPILNHTGVQSLLSTEELESTLEPFTTALKTGKLTGLCVVPVVIIKEHNQATKILEISGGIGSLCIHMLEPYSMNEYISNLHFEKPAAHLVQHIYYDLARSAPRLPSHLVAFVLLYLIREEGVSREDLIDYMDWFRNDSLEFDLQIAFAGKSEHVIDVAINILRDYIHIDSHRDVFYPIHLERLSDYAATLAPNLVYHGIICRTILRLYNSDPKNTFLLCFNPSHQVRVMKDDVLELSVKLAEQLKSIFSRPCASITTHLSDTLSRMETFGKYFKTQEPKVRRNAGKPWCGDSDTDEEYYWSKKDDPAFKTWLILTTRPYRLDRLNLFMNSVDAYFA